MANVLQRTAAILRPHHFATRAIRLTYTSRRSFQSTSACMLRSTELSKTDLSKLKVNSDRLWNDIHSTARWTEPTGGDPEDIKAVGLKRLTLSKEDKSARDWFVATTEALGCKTHVDEIGNIFAIRPGLNNNAPATFAGSHLDSQPSGGRFDGILGVTAAIEMLRTLDDNWIETEGPVGVVNWTNEEGAKYPISMMGSGVWSGRVGLEDAWTTQSVTPGGPVTTVKGELQQIGYFGSIPATPQGTPIGAHFELHIEQGPKLEAAGHSIGIVQGVQAYKWFEIIISGRESHAGTTDFDHRGDALYSAALFIATVREIAKDVKGLSTVGMLEVSPGSVNTIPGQVKLSLDIRHSTDQGLAQMLHMIRASAQQISNFAVGGNDDAKTSHLTQISFQMKETFNSAAIKFQDAAISCVQDATATVLGSEYQNLSQKMVSGAGHDSVCTSMHAPTAMIFIPCKDGVSHNPREWSEQVDCEAGANVLTHSILRMDKLRKQNGDFD